MNDRPTFDPIWEEKYQMGHAQRYPWDVVVSFVYRHFPRDKERRDIRILEVGCGTGSNLWFAAREGFDVSGIDASPSAIAFARKRFAEDHLAADFHVGDFTRLPFPSAAFDLVIDRESITCCGLSAASDALKEVRRVLQQGGKFLSNLYSSQHSSSHAGIQAADGLTVNITGGTLTGVGQICFYGPEEIDALFAQGWSVLSRQHLEIVETMAGANSGVHAEWRVIAQKLEDSD